jgi:hypothetical protein
MNDQGRLKYIKEYFNKQGKIKVEVPAQISKTTKGNIIYRFNGYRCGYLFKDGVAYVERKDLHLFLKSFPHMIINEGEEIK